MGDFPVDEATLVMLRYSLSAHNFEDGRSHLLDFLAMGEAEPTKRTLISDEGDDMPIYEVEYPKGEEPWSAHEVIRALIDEVVRLRGMHPDG